MTDARHIITSASGIMTEVYSFPCAEAGLPGFYEGRAIVHYGRREISAVCYARGPERAIAMALEKVARMTLRAFPALREGGDGE